MYELNILHNLLNFIYNKYYNVIKSYVIESVKLYIYTHLFIHT